MNCFCDQYWTYQYKSDLDIIGFQHMATKVIKGPEHFSYEDALTEPIQPGE